MEMGIYQEIYGSLNSFDDVGKISRRFQLPPGVVTTILDQKIVAKVRRNHSRVANRGRKHLHSWKKGRSMLDLARSNGLPATLMVSVILKEMEFSHKEMIRDPYNVKDRRLRSEILDALESDIFFSPRAHELQAQKGQRGEDLVGRWLDINDVAYRSEEELRSEGMVKTPDFLLDSSIVIDGREISWIESKALFGNEREHKRYLKKQFCPYEELYGNGMVVYWYGFIDSISMHASIVKDHSFFYEISDEVGEFLNSTFKW